MPVKDVWNFVGLCLPAQIYFVISIIGLLVLAITNTAGDPNTLLIGSMRMYVPSVLLVFVWKFIYIVFWTYVLNLICNDSHADISWLLISIPLLLSIIAVLVLILSQVQPKRNGS